MEPTRIWSKQFMRTKGAAGFTLVEVLVVAPIIVLFIGAFIGLVISLTGDSLQNRTTNEVTYQVRSALDAIEAENSRTSDAYLVSTGSLTSPQGSDGATGAFTVTNNDTSATDTDVLILKAPATTQDPVNPNRNLIRYNTPNACNSTNVTQNAYYPVTTVYFVSSGTLLQRTILPSSGTPCSTPYQKSSCQTAGSGVCAVADTKLAENVTTFSVQYLDAAGAAVSSANPAMATSLKVTLKVNRSVAGRTISYSGNLQTTALNKSTWNGHIQTITTANCPPVRTEAVDARDNRTYWIQQMGDGKCWMLTNLAYAGGGTNTYGDVKTITQTSAQSYTNAYYFIPTGANPTTSPTDPSTSTSGTGQYGYLYNWCAAMGSQTSTSACSNSTTPAPDAAVSICPSGWRLPTGVMNGEFTNLTSAVGGTTDANLRTSWLAQRSGYWDSVFSQQSTYGYYWSSSQNTSTAAYDMALSGTSVYPTGSSTSNLTKYNGIAVRCIAA